MQKRYLLIIMALLLLGAFHSPAHAVPDKNSYPDIDVWPRFWQWESPWGRDTNNLYAGAKILNNKGEIIGKFMEDEGCLVTSFAMLYNFYGMRYKPAEDHFPTLNPACEGKLDSYYCNVGWYLYKRNNPGTFNKWLTDNGIYTARATTKNGKPYTEHILYPPKMLKILSLPWESDRLS